MRQDDGRLGGGDAHIASDLHRKAIDQRVDIAAHIVAHHQAAKGRCARIAATDAALERGGRFHRRSGHIDQAVEIDRQPAAGVVEVFAAQIKDRVRTLEHIGGVGRALHLAPQLGVAEVGLVQTRRFQVFLADVLVQVARLAAAQARLELDAVAGGHRLGPVEGGVGRPAHAHPVAKDHPLGARHVGVGHAKEVDEGAHGHRQLALLARDHRQVDLGDDACIVGSAHAQAARTNGEVAHRQRRFGRIVGDGRQRGAADHVAGQHKACRHALGGCGSAGSGSGTSGRTTARTVGSRGRIERAGRLGQLGRDLVFDLGQDLGFVGGSDGHGTSRVHIGVVQIGFDLGFFFVADLAAHQGVDGGKQHVLRLPAYGVEGQRDADGGAVGADGAVVGGADAGGVAALDADPVLFGGDGAVRDEGSRLVEDEVGGNRPAHGQALAGAATGLGHRLQAGLDAGCF